MKVATIFWSVVGYSTLVAGILQDGTSNATGDAIQQWQAIAGYVPGSNVADTNAIDLDQREMEVQLLLQNEEGLRNADRVYALGGHSRSIATLTLTQPLAQRQHKGESVRGVDADGNDVFGTILADVHTSSTTIELFYDGESGCYVGGLQGEVVQTNGCLAPNGNITVTRHNGVLSFELSYSSYDAVQQTRNGRTIRLLSTRANTKMVTCQLGCPFPEFERYAEHYGVTDYADAWVRATVNGTKFHGGLLDQQSMADFSVGVGNLLALRAASMQWGTILLNFWMFVIAEVREASAVCLDRHLNTGPNVTNNGAIHSWDSAVAMYTGSLVGHAQDSVHSGVLLYTVANKLCADTHTCDGNSTVGNSLLNQKLFALFQRGRDLLVLFDCEGVRVVASKIINLLQILLIQGTLRSAHHLDAQRRNDRSPASLGQGAAFLASIFPLIQSCNQDSANVLHENLRVGSTIVDFAAVKQALEGTYECLAIRCADVGGIWDQNSQQYYPGAEPCRDGTNAIAGYVPAAAIITQTHAVVDIDVGIVEEFAALETADGFTTARKVYRQGGPTRLIGTLYLNLPLAHHVPLRTLVTGVNSEGELVEAVVRSAFFMGGRQLQITYLRTNCVVGDLKDPGEVDGCFAHSGVVLIGDLTGVRYTYNSSDATPWTPTIAATTLRDFSDLAHVTMQNCTEGCPYPEFTKFFNYYGVANYGDLWVEAAIHAGETQFTYGRANFFSGEGQQVDFRRVAFTQGMVLLNIWLYVTREMEFAVNQCNVGCTDCNQLSLLHWDEAVALYTGSLVGDRENSVVEGKLLYSIANKRCVDFKTCGAEGKGTIGNSHVNRKIFEWFNNGKTHLLNGDCALAVIAKTKIVQSMAIPLVQGTLRFAYDIGRLGDRTPRLLAEGSVYAAAVLPLVHSCNPDDAQVIYSNMRVGSETTAFRQVLDAFERSYTCLGITCEGVGGYWDAASQQYFDGAAPCTSTDTKATNIAGYIPTTPVSNLVLVDLDQNAIERNLALASHSGFQDAKRIYQLGGFVASIATLSLQRSLTGEVADGTTVEALSEEGALIQGTVTTGGYVGSSSILIQYKNPGCEVGGLTGNEIHTGGCFAQNGVIVVPDNPPLRYSYVPTTDNQNGITIQDFSKSAPALMGDCPIGCPYPDFLRFKTYYGSPEYAHEWIMAALDGTTTVMSKGNADFSTGIGNDLELRAEAVKHATAYMSIWMYVIYLFESSLDSCQAGCIDCNSASIDSWDEGVALYTGSMVGSEENSVVRGELMYTLANHMCSKFKTCGPDGDMADGNSSINRRLFQLFNQGQRHLDRGECSNARATVTKVAALMRVPLIQGTLRSAYTIGAFRRRHSQALGRGAAFAASILPQVSACSPEDANKIYSHMRVDADRTNFDAVKQALERNYRCMGIVCADVGGYWDAANREYFEGAEACMDAKPSLGPTLAPTPQPTVSPRPTPAPIPISSALSQRPWVTVLALVLAAVGVVI